MASTIGTNVVADEQQYFKVIESILSVLENAYMKNDENHKQTKLMNQLRHHLQAHGQIAYSLVPAQFKDKVIDLLEAQSIPYMALPDSKGNFMIVTRDIDSDRLMQIQKDVECLSTDYVRELTPQNMLNLYRVHGIKNVDTLHFKSGPMFEVAKEKLYQAGVPFAEVPLEKGQGYELIVSPTGKFSKDGKDLSSFELQHAYEQSKGDSMFRGENGKTSAFMNTRLAQASYDKAQMEDFAKKAIRGEEVVLCSTLDEQRVCIQSDQNGIHVLESKDGKWKTTDLAIDPKATPKDVVALISKYTDQIHNKGVISLDQFEKFKDKKLELKSKDGKTAVCYKTGDKDGKSVYKLASFSKISSQKFKSEFSFRPGEESISKDVKNYQYISSSQVEPMLKAINAEATRVVRAQLGDGVYSTERAYQMKHDAICKIMHDKELSQIQEFLKGDERMDQASREEWFDNICEHFENTMENTKYSCDLGKTSTKDMAAQLAKGQENVMSMNKDKEVDLD